MRNGTSACKAQTRMWPACWSRCAAVQWRSRGGRDVGFHVLAQRIRRRGGRIANPRHSKMRPHRRCRFAHSKAPEARRRWLRASSTGVQQPLRSSITRTLRRTVTGLSQISSRISASCAGPVKRASSSPGSAPASTASGFHSQDVCWICVNAQSHQNAQSAPEEVVMGYHCL